MVRLEAEEAADPRCHLERRDRTLAEPRDQGAGAQEPRSVPGVARLRPGTYLRWCVSLGGPATLAGAEQGVTIEQDVAG